jgi:hypothetical protein
LNEQSLQAANEFLRVASVSIQPGDVLDRSPTEIGKEAGLPNPLSVARAVRALAARRRLETAEGGRYRLLDARPLDPGEPESVPRPPRKRKVRRRGTARPEARTTPDRRPTYSDLGRAIVERIIDLGREAGEAVAANDHLRRDAKENRAIRIEAEQRASKLQERVRELEHKLDMAEGNLRTVLAAARGRGVTAAPTDNEMETLLKILKGPGNGDPGAADPAPGESAPGESASAMAPADPGLDAEPVASADDDERANAGQDEGGPAARDRTLEAPAE